MTITLEIKEKKKRGRPKGSKNKLKETKKVLKEEIHNINLTKRATKSAVQQKKEADLLRSPLLPTPAPVGKVGGVKSHLIGGDIKDTLKKAAKTVKKTVSKVKDVATKLAYGTTELPPQAENTVNRFADAIIQHATIIRIPLSKTLMTVLNVSSGGEFSKKMENEPYDTLYHLRMDFNTNQGTICCEKNEVINIQYQAPIPPKAEFLQVHTPAGLTIRQMIENTKAFMGVKFLGYSSKDNNCMNFVMGMLSANHMDTPQAREFTMKNVKSLFSDNFRKLTNTVTDIGAKAAIITQGGAIAKRPRGRPRKVPIEGGATALQKGTAAQMRTFTTGRKNKNDLNLITHSGDKDASKRGYNQFADFYNNYDAKAENAIIEAIPDYQTHYNMAIDEAIQSKKRAEEAAAAAAAAAAEAAEKLKAATPAEPTPTPEKVYTLSDLIPVMSNGKIQYILDSKTKIPVKKSIYEKLLKEEEAAKTKGKGLGGCVDCNGYEPDYLVESVLFNKDKFHGVPKAKKWLKDNGFEFKKVDYKENTLRFRQRDPEEIEKEGYTEYRTKKLGDSGVELIIAYKKNKISGNGIMEKHIHHHHYHYNIKGKGLLDPPSRGTMTNPSYMSNDETGYARVKTDGDLLYYAPVTGSGMGDSSSDSSSDEEEGGKISFKSIKKGIEKVTKNPIVKKLRSDLLPQTTDQQVRGAIKTYGPDRSPVPGSEHIEKLTGVKMPKGYGPEDPTEGAFKGTTTGAGVVKKPHMIKGSKEAKAFMADLRARRAKK